MEMPSLSPHARALAALKSSPSPGGRQQELPVRHTCGVVSVVREAEEAHAPSDNAEGVDARGLPPQLGRVDGDARLRPHATPVPLAHRELLLVCKKGLCELVLEALRVLPQYLEPVLRKGQALRALRRRERLLRPRALTPVAAPTMPLPTMRSRS